MKQGNVLANKKIKKEDGFYFLLVAILTPLHFADLVYGTALIQHCCDGATVRPTLNKFLSREIFM